MKKFMLYAVTLSSFCMMNHALLAGRTYLPKPEELTFDEHKRGWVSKTRGQYEIDLTDDFGASREDIPIQLIYIDAQKFYMTFKTALNNHIRLYSAQPFPASCDLKQIEDQWVLIDED